MRGSKILTLVFTVALVLGIGAAVSAYGTSGDSDQSRGYAYWMSNSSSGYYDNSGAWRSWNYSPANFSRCYGSNGNEISWGNKEQWYAEWDGNVENGVYYTNDGQRCTYRRRVKAYYQLKLNSSNPLTISPTNLAVSSTSASNPGELIVTANYADGTHREVTRDCQWSTSNSSVAWVADNSNGTVILNGSTGAATINATYRWDYAPSSKSISARVTVASSSSTTSSMPTAPNGLIATPASSSQIDLRWDSVSGASNYRVYYSNGSLIGTTSSTRYSVTGLAAGSTYYFYVTASSSAGESGNNGTASATTNSSCSQKTLQYISVSPPCVNLSSTCTSQHLTVYAHYSDGSTPEVTSNANISSSDSNIVSVSSGTVKSKGNSGNATITVDYKGQSAQVPVNISIDNTPLTVQGVNPSNTSGVALNTPVQIYFNKNVVQGSNSITVNGGSQSIYGMNINQNLCTFYISGETNNTTYTINIPSGAFKDVSTGVSNDAYTFSFTTTQTAPTVPSNLNYSVNNNSVYLTWSSASDVTGYYVYRNGAQVATANTNSYTDCISLGNGTTYTYYVIAYNSQGNSGASNTVTVATQTQAVPTAPSNLNYSLNNNSVYLTWSSASDVTGYYVYRNGAQVATANTNSYTDCISLGNGTTYTYYVIAYNSQGNSGASNAVTVTATTQAVPTAPSNLNYSVNNNSVYLTWSSVSGATGYYVYRNGAQVATVNTNSYTDYTSASNGTTYAYYVIAYNSQGNSGASNTVTVSGTTQLAIQSTIPSNGATGVTTNSQVQLYFNQSVVTGPNVGNITVNGSTQNVYGLTVNQTSCSFYINGQTANMSYTVYIPSGAFKDTAGNLNNEYTLSFSTTQSQKTPQSISIIPSTVNICTSYTAGQYLTVQAQYTDGTTGIITNGATFTSANSSVAYVSNGIVYGTSVGTTMITAYYQGLQAYSTITVSGNTQGLVNTPIASVASGVIYQPISVMLTADSGATIRYTIDNSEPTSYSTIYTTPIYVSSTTTIKAKAFLGTNTSPTMNAVYVFGQSNSNINDMLSRAKALYNSGKYDDAIALLNQLLGLSADNQDAVILLADCYLKKSDLGAAKSRLLQFINVYEYPRVVNKYAEICINRGEYSEAKQKIVNILPRYQNEIYLYSTLVRAYEHLGITGIRVFSLGTEIDFAQYDNIYPTLSSGRTIVPIRALAESLGATVNWINDTTAIIKLGSKNIEVTKDSKIAKINGASYVMDIPASISGTRLMVPLRFISENFGYQVNWYSIESTVNIISITDNK